jgi:hypothetical protein
MITGTLPGVAIQSGAQSALSWEERQMIRWPRRARTRLADADAAQKPPIVAKPAPPPVWQGGEILTASSGKLHLEVDFEAVRRGFTASSLDGGLKGERVTGPYELFAVETLRDRLGLRTGRALPTDVFVFGNGDAPRRDATKVGGLPYWPGNRPWPKDSAGVPYRYLAQFNFADSRDLFPDLPGDVLVLLVGEEGDDWLAVEPLAIHLEWLSLGLVPIASLEPALMANPALAFFGAIHRTADYPDVEKVAKKSGVRGGSLMAIINGTKIGGWPHPIQDYDRDFKGALLCQLGSIGAKSEVPYPWVNHPAPIELSFADPVPGGVSNSLSLMDAGIVYVFRNEDGTFRTSFQTY